jgi:hypothetical protein
MRYDVIKRFSSTGIGNESPFDGAKAKEWNRRKAESRRRLEEHKKREKGFGDKDVVHTDRAGR